MRFQPEYDRDPRPTFGEVKPGLKERLSVAAQLLAIFVLFRLVLLDVGIVIVDIPVIDPILNLVLEAIREWV